MDSIRPRSVERLRDVRARLEMVPVVIQILKYDGWGEARLDSSSLWMCERASGKRLWHELLQSTLTSI